MAKQNQTKIKLLLLWDILQADSDEENPLSTADILAKLEEKGIVCDRRTLYSDIKTLNEYGYGVSTVLKNHTNNYFVSERGFNVPELKILMDAVTAANFISAKRTRELHSKIAGLEGGAKAELLKKSQLAENLVKTENESVFYSVNELDNAITNCKQIAFSYFDYTTEGEKKIRKGGELYVVNPLCTVFSESNYYLVGFVDEESQLRHYRIDRMQNVKVLESEQSKPAWLRRVKLAEHKKATFSMFGGEKVCVTIEADNSLSGVIFDKFGTSTKLKFVSPSTFSFKANINVSPTFFGWCLSFSSKLKVIEPAEITEKLKEYICELSMQY